VVTTAILAFIDITHWYVIPLFWALLPAVCFFLFFSAPFPEPTPEEKRQKASGIMRNPVYLLLLAVMFLGAASEVTMNQFASTFAEKALGLDKATGDLIGMCGFAAMLGLGRTLQTMFSHKINLNKVLIASAIGAFVCYIAAAVCPIAGISIAACALCGLCTALLWPGSAIVATDHFPLAGSWLYASLAVLGDSGAAAIPFVTGSLADLFQGDTAAGFAHLIGVSPSEGGLRLALLCASVCPLVCTLCHYLLYKRAKKY
jgi:fucose permease